MNRNRIRVVVVWLAMATLAPAQTDASTNSLSTIVPAQVRYTGALPGHAGERLSLEFSIYAAPDSGSALWSERQSIEVGADASYTVLLGAGSSIGLPPTVFAAGEARWLGVRTGNGEELPRVLLASVPYAMKAADAETVGGVPARTFVTQQQLATMARTLAAQMAPAVLPQTTPSGTGTANYLAMWTNSTTLGNSLLYQSGSNVGIGTSGPSSALHVFSGDLTVGNLALKFPTTPLGSASINQVSSSSPSLFRQTLVDSSGRFNMYWNAYNDAAGNKYYTSGEPATKWNIGGVGGSGGTAVYVAPSGSAGGPIKWNTVLTSDALGNTSLANQAMILKAGGSVGIGAPNPAARLEVNGTAKFDGLVSFAPSQTFPGTGTITGITTSSPLTGSGTSGSVALSLNTSALETTLNTQYAQLGSVNTFTQPVTLSGGASASQSGGSTQSALTGIGTNGSTGVYGSSDTGNAAVFSNNNIPNATMVVTNNGTGSQFNNPTALNATANGVYAIGVAATTMGSNATSIKGTANDGSAGNFSNNSVYDPAVFAENLAVGTANGYPPHAMAVSADGDYGTAVWGLADGDNGWGIYANAVGNGGVGVYGEADGFVDTGGSGRVPIGVKGLGTTSDGYGVVGDETANGGYGVYAHASGAADSLRGDPVGNYGLADKGIGVLGVLSSNSGTYTRYNGAGLLAGVWGDTSVAEQAGVNGTADNAAAANFINNSNSYSTVYLINNGKGGTGAVVLSASTPAGSCNITDGDFACTGQMKSLVSVDGARTVETYAVRSPENWSEDFGTGTLVHGVAVIELDAGFAQTIASDASYHVFLTPRGDSNGLYVTNLTPTSFEVRESHGGTSSLDFDYRIVAKQRGYETERLADVTERVRSQRQAMLRHLSAGNASAPARLAHEQPLEGRQPFDAKDRMAQLHRNLRPGGLAPGFRPPAATAPAAPKLKPLPSSVQPK